MKLASRIADLPSSSIAAQKADAERLRNSGKIIIDLAMGKPSHAISESAKGAMIAPIQSGELPYGTPAGDMRLREAIAEHLNEVYRLTDSRYNANNVVITEGSATATFLAQGLVLEPGNKALFIAPAYSSYAPAVKYLGADYVVVRASKYDGFQPDVAALRRCFEENHYVEDGVAKNHIRTVMLNYPNNPTGAVLSEEKVTELTVFLEEMAESYKASGFLVLLDESYMHLSKTPHTSILQRPLSPALRENIIVLGSSSKLSAIPGARCGYAVASQHYAPHISKSNGAVMLGANIIGQEALLADLQSMTQEQIQEINHYYHEKVEFVTAELNEIGRRAQWGARAVPVPVAPAGGMFVFADLSGMIGRQIPISLQGEFGGKTMIEHDEDIAKYLLHFCKDTELNPSGAGVSVVPGSGFFMPKEKGFVRLCVAGEFNKHCTEDKDIHTAMEVIKSAALAQIPERLQQHSSAKERQSSKVMSIY